MSAPPSDCRNDVSVFANSSTSVATAERSRGVRSVEGEAKVVASVVGPRIGSGIGPGVARAVEVPDAVSVASARAGTRIEVAAVAAATEPGAAREDKALVCFAACAIPRCVSVSANGSSSSVRSARAEGDSVGGGHVASVRKPAVVEAEAAVRARAAVAERAQLACVFGRALPSSIST